MENAENHDNYQYTWVMFERDTVVFVVRAVDFYLSLLGDEEQELASDPDLSALITDETRRDFGLKRDKERALRLKEWLQSKLDEREESHHVSISLSHWLVRFMKSVSFLYLAKLKNRRNKLASKSNVTASTLTLVDREISAKEELFSSAGIFKNASPLELLAKYEPASETAPTTGTESEKPLLGVSRPRPILVGSIEILDHELRERCLDLFNQFQESGQTARNDTVVSEASRILENRLRLSIASGDGLTAKQLVTLAFNPETPRLRVSKIRAEQEAALLLFLGTFGFIRNQVQHKLLANMPAERVLQILGWTDYLLAVIAQSERVENAT